MKSLPVPGFDPPAIFKAAVAAKKGPRRKLLKRLTPAVLARFDLVVDANAFVAGIAEAAYSDNEHDALCHCYEHETKATRDMIATIRQPDPISASLYCPYCSIGVAETVDHYLPQDCYPEFSIHPVNLLPACIRCNTKKGNAVPDGGRRIFHPYVDGIPDVKFVTANCSYSADRPLVRFDADFTLVPAVLRPLLKAHFGKLGLLQRYGRHASGMFGEVLRDVRGQTIIQTANQVRQSLRDSSATWAQTFSKNHWKAVMYDALSHDDAFIDACVAP